MKNILDDFRFSLLQEKKESLNLLFMETKQIKAVSFKPLNGFIYIVTHRGGLVAQGVFKTSKTAVKFANRMLKAGDTPEIFVGKFIDENTIEVG